MQSDSGSQSPDHQPEVQPSRSDSPDLGKFKITREDADILKGMVDEFQEADADVRNTIIAAAMAELYELRPADEPFNKLEVKAVCLSIHWIKCSLC
jgi:hypothetical protein